jgi:hypothetical protein
MEKSENLLEPIDFLFEHLNRQHGHSFSNEKNILKVVAIQSGFQNLADRIYEHTTPHIIITTETLFKFWNNRHKEIGRQVSPQLLATIFLKQKNIDVNAHPNKTKPYSQYLSWYENETKIQSPTSGEIIEPKINQAESENLKTDIGIQGSESHVGFTTQEINETHKRLRDYNNNDDIPTGRLEAEVAFITYRYRYPKIIKDLFMFNMRQMRWARINQVIEACDIEQSEELKTIFELHLAECEIKKALQNKDNKHSFLEKLNEAEKHLGLVPPDFQQSENYYYWTGRCYLESWWITRDSKNISILGQALDNFKWALNIAGPDSWWLLIYICIVKSIQLKKFRTELDSFKTAVNKRRIKHPRLASAKIYLITGQILDDYCDNKNDLPVVLKSISKPNSTTDFEDTILHHIELIFYKDEIMCDRYGNIVREWLGD